MESVVQANELIDELLEDNSELWKPLYEKLKRVKKMHYQLMKNYNLKNPTYEALQKIEQLKSFREDNLNTTETMKDDRWGKVVEVMSALKVKTMAKIFC